MEIEEKTKSRRNNEKRKEKSRYAAKCRRSKESEIFTNLANTLPIKESAVAHLDKATIMRLGIAYLRIRNLFKKSVIEDSVPNEPDKLSLVALGGIILALTIEGDIVYISNNVSVYLGLTQIELMGQNIFDVSHPCDHKEIKDVLSGKNCKDGNWSFFMRMKCTLTNKGRNLNLKSASYKVLHIIGTMMKSDELESSAVNHFIAIGSPIPHPANIEIPLGSFTFLSKHSLDMKFTYADERMKNFLGYSPENLIGKSLYEFHHVLDNSNIQSAFKSLFSKGQSETDHYRFLVKGGGFVWVYTQATIIYSDKGSKPESVVCVNYVVSERMNESEIYSSNQLEGYKSKVEAPVVSKPIASTAKVIVKFTSTEEAERPQLATRKIFAPRTPEMNKGFLTFADDESGSTTLKDEPDDLTHLAPTAGDTCISLDTSPFNQSIVDDFSSQVSDEFSPLLHQDRNAKLFIPNLDDSSNSLSPAMSKSPGASSLPSLCNTTTDGSGFEDSSVKSFLNFDSNDNNTDDFSFKAPYISMTECDDLPLLLTSEYWPVYNSSCTTSVLSSGSSSPVGHILPEDNIGKLLSSNNTSESFQDHGGGAMSSFLLQRPYESQTEIDSRKRTINDLYDSNVAVLAAKKMRPLDDKSTLSEQSNSVLMNLLVAGHDVNAGYMCINTRKKTSPDKSSRLPSNL